MQQPSGPAGQSPHVREVRLVVMDEPCPYLPGCKARLEGFFADQLGASVYRRLMDLAFRRSGRFFYHTVCGGCRECVPIRVPTALFLPSRSQRRCWKRNRRLQVTVAPPQLSDEKHSLYSTYVQEKHGKSEINAVGATWDFLYNRVVPSLEFCYRDWDGKLLAVGICDVFDDALSSVYCFYDVGAASRGLGTFSALYELDYAKRMGLAYYYLGFLVSNCPAMAYKAAFRPYELLDAGGAWKSAAARESRINELQDGMS